MSFQDETVVIYGNEKECTLKHRDQISVWWILFAAAFCCSLLWLVQEWSKCYSGLHVAGMVAVVLFAVFVPKPNNQSLSKEEA